MNLKKYRPWILCIESHLPLRPDIQTYEEWEDHVLDYGYEFAFTDTINRYYVAQEHADRRASFSFPSEYYIHVSDIYNVKTLEKRILLLEADMGAIKGIIEKY